MRKFVRRFRPFGRFVLVAAIAMLLALAFVGQALAAGVGDNSGDVLSQDQMWTGLVGAFLPPLIALVQSAKWTSQIRAVVAFGICTAVAAVTVVLIDNHWDWGNWVKSTLLVLTAALVTYKAIWKPVGLTRKSNPG